MGQYVLRRILFAIPTIVAISFVIFLILDLAPGDPTGGLPLTIPDEIRQRIRESLGFNDPFLVKWWKWMRLMFINEPLHAIDSILGTCIGECENRARIISWSSRAPAVDIIYQRLPQTIWILGLSFVLGTLIAIPVGVISAYRQYTLFDNIGTFVTMVGFSVPTFFTGVAAILVFSVWLGWFPSFYDGTLVVDSWDSFVVQVKQSVMPVAVLTLFNTAALSRFTRASVLDNLSADYVRTARSKGLAETNVVTIHVLRNSIIPVVVLLALAIPGIFGGAIITEQIFRINGVGHLLIASIGQGDVPMVQTITVVIAILIVIFNLIADVLLGMFDPRIRYD